MKEDHAVEFVAVKDGPPTSEYMLRFVVAIPSKLDGGLSISLCDSTVHLAVHTSELQLASVAAFEFNERLEFL